MSQEASFDSTDEIFRIVGAAMEVHSNLHGGLLEPPYQDALEIEFGFRGIPFVREALQPIYYKGTKLRSSYRPDFICFDGIVVELKAMGTLPRVRRGGSASQLLADHPPSPRCTTQFRSEDTST